MQPLAFHCPCTLQHAQGLGGEVEKILSQLGFTLAPVMEGHLCCGSAGTYSITQPELSRQLRDRKLEALEANGPARIATANILKLDFRTVPALRHVGLGRSIGFRHLGSVRL